MSVSVPCSGFLLATPFSLLADLSQLSKLFTNHRRPASRTHHNKLKVRQSRDFRKVSAPGAKCRISDSIKGKNGEYLHTRFKLHKTGLKKGNISTILGLHERRDIFKSIKVWEF